MDRSSKTITFVRNEKWWGNRAKLDMIVYRVIEPDAQIDALANGEIDGAQCGHRAVVRFVGLGDLANFDLCGAQIGVAQSAHGFGR